MAARPACSCPPSSRIGRTARSPTSTASISAGPGAGVALPARSLPSSPRWPATPPRRISTPAFLMSPAIIWASIGSRRSPCWRSKKGPEMTGAMDDKYLHLGRLIAARCPPGFREARLAGEFDADRAELSLTWTARDHSKHDAPFQDPTSELHSALDDIREAMARENGGKRWRTFAVTLREGGHFRLDVDD